MRLRTGIVWSLSAATLMGSAQGVSAQDVQQLEEVVVTGIRQSLERAADIKREAAQVVDSIVAEDIGKFPDATTAAALQRVPGIQVTVGSNNEIVGVRIRGLDDILTTVDGRELFSTASRGFDLQELPAEALARVDIIKSSTANLIEGGIAGVTDLRLNKPFNFNEPTVVLAGRANYPDNVDEVNPQFGVLATDRWDVGDGEIGALVNVSWYRNEYDRPVSMIGERRSLIGSPFAVPGVLAPITFGGYNDYGWYERPQANVALQWRATDNLEVYVDGLYAGFRSDFQSVYLATPFFSPGTTVERLEVDESRCFLARVRADGNNPNRADLDGTTPFTSDTLCNLESARFNNVRALTSTQGRTQEVDNTLGGGGVKWNNGSTQVQFDLAFQKSESDLKTVIVDVGKNVTADIHTNRDEGGVVTVLNNELGTQGGFVLRNGLVQNFQQSTGELWQSRFDVQHDLDGAFGFLKSLEAGVRYADRSALFQHAQVNTPVPNGIAARTIDSLLPADFLVHSPSIERINGGTPWLIPNPDYLRSAAGRDMLRGVFGVALGDPAYQAQRRFDASEETYAAYVQLGYDFALSDTITVDGLIGVRPTRTKRRIEGAGLVSNVLVPRIGETTDTDVLPSASARIDFGNGLQSRLAYSKTMRRPEFSSLNPGLSYAVSTNPAVVNGGSAGNPELKPQISDSFDATLEYYFGPSMVSVALYYRDLADRVISSVQAEVIDGITYNISRPRNVSAAELQGIEVAGQTFFDFLPGVWSGFGAFANYTYADTEVKGNDPLAGYELQGVSKNNFTVGMLYEKFGLSGRLVYTYRSRYYDQDTTGLNIPRPIDADRVNDRDYLPIGLNFVRPNGRLDFSIGYDITDAIRVDVGGSNILGDGYRSYFDYDWVNRHVRYDDTIYTMGIRIRM